MQGHSKLAVSRVFFFKRPPPYVSVQQAVPKDGYVVDGGSLMKRITSHLFYFYHSNTLIPKRVSGRGFGSNIVYAMTARADLSKIQK